jgi:hypothetical protein
MAYHDELMAHALDLIHVSPPSEMHLRRAVSAAYYAVFHLPIFESTQHWDNPALDRSRQRLRPRLNANYLESRPRQ